MKVIISLLDRMARYQRAQLSPTDGMARATQEHEAILKACEASDADLAAKWTYEHIQGVKASLLCYLDSKKINHNHTRPVEAKDLSDGNVKPKGVKKYLIADN